MQNAMVRSQLIQLAIKRCTVARKIPDLIELFPCQKTKRVYELGQFAQEVVV